MTPRQMKTQIDTLTEPSAMAKCTANSLSRSAIIQIEGFLASSASYTDQLTAEEARVLKEAADRLSTILSWQDSDL